ncbi:uncharacterized protein LOC126083717 [Elephas maximus indicus]|uniref:uncharacterized protein LOC126083717 n=1 Tax=Elephas maximus indicus TaxID=99487 RepID=UPI0021163FD7|nr:uncharacterized protein LOC126083717 [Elephas maximus indicus]
MAATLGTRAGDRGGGRGGAGTQQGRQPRRGSGGCARRPCAWEGGRPHSLPGLRPQRLGRPQRPDVHAPPALPPRRKPWEPPSPRFSPPPASPTPGLLAPALSRQLPLLRPRSRHVRPGSCQGLLGLSAIPHLSTELGLWSRQAAPRSPKSASVCAREAKRIPSRPARGCRHSPPFRRGFLDAGDCPGDQGKMTFMTSGMPKEARTGRLLHRALHSTRICRVDAKGKGRTFCVSAHDILRSAPCGGGIVMPTFHIRTQRLREVN